ncbi:MAG TPA: sodium:calcium symporter [Methylomirabilota bacterium]|nr:sodium:calcium symporter [Methylomirabilota bacterium]
MNQAVTDWIESAGSGAPWLCAGIFLLGSALMIWRLESLGASGIEGTVLGTLVMPYCSGLGNLIFAYVLGKSGGNSREVMTNCLVNNVTNMTLLIGLPAVFWGLSLAPNKPAKPKKGKTAGAEKQRVNRLSLLLTMLAVLFFTGAMWVVGRDGRIDFADGLILVGLFLFWQTFHVFEVLKTNARQKRSFGFLLLIDLPLLLVSAYAVFISIDWLVNWVQSLHAGFISAENLGWLSGWLMVLPNALLALYYGLKRRAEVVYTSQIGDGHICIPLCIGIFALFRPIPVPDFFQLGVGLLLGAVAVHFFFIAAFGKLPRVVGALLVASYGVFLWKGLEK